MNLLLLTQDEVVLGEAGSVAVLTGRRAEHLRKVLKVEPGKMLRAGLLKKDPPSGFGPFGQAEVLAVDGKTSVTVRFVPDSGLTGRKQPEVDVIVGMPRPQVLHRVLQTTASMSVRRLDLVNAWRVEKSYFHTPSLADDKIERQLRLGAEQGMTTRLPAVHCQHLLVPFLRQASQGETLDLIAHPNAEIDIEEALAAASSIADPDRPVRLAIGPEGGWIDREIDTFQECGFRPVLLGPWVLRVEVALAVALGQLEAARRVRKRSRVLS